MSPSLEIAHDQSRVGVAGRQGTQETLLPYLIGKRGRKPPYNDTYNHCFLVFSQRRSSCVLLARLLNAFFLPLGTFRAFMRRHGHVARGSSFTPRVERHRPASPGVNRFGCLAMTNQIVSQRARIFRHNGSPLPTPSSSTQKVKLSPCVIEDSCGFMPSLREEYETPQIR